MHVVGAVTIADDHRRRVALDQRLALGFAERTLGTLGGALPLEADGDQLRDCDASFLMQRNPMWQVAVSIVSLCRAGGRKRRQ